MAWELDANHSHALFSVRNLASGTIRGRFNSIRGYLYVDQQNPSHSWIDIEVDAVRIDTGDAHLDARLRSKDILDVDAYPTIVFKSSRVDHVEGSEYMVSGELTVHGVTREVTFGATFNSDLSEADYAALTARATLNGKDFGLVGEESSAPGLATADELVRIGFDLELVSRRTAGSRSA